LQPQLGDAVDGWPCGHRFDRDLFGVLGPSGLADGGEEVVEGLVALGSEVSVAPPQQVRVAANQPTAVDDFGTTVEEQIEGELLDMRVNREIPEDQAMFGGGEQVVQPARAIKPDRTDDPDALTEDSGLGVGADLDTNFEPDARIQRTGTPSRKSRPAGSGTNPAGRNGN
jgi:hypothetical protein